MQKFFIIILVVLIAGCNSSSGSKAAPAAKSKGFVKQVTVFGIPVKATASVSNEKLLHAAGVMAEYLDNDEDGTPDNPDVVDQMVEKQAVLMMFGTENEISTVFPNESDSPRNGQDLYASETHPEGPQSGAFDASLEEVLHLITHIGYANVYPAVFGEFSGSLVADAMDKARGGSFEEIPAEYPAEAWYTYDDKTCEYSCQVTEYTYWALTSILGAQDYEGRLDEIRQEWRLNTREKVKLGDPDMYDILTDSNYILPGTLPDGNYTGGALSVKPFSGI